MTCPKCKAEIEPTALIFGTRPGATCKCTWQTLTPKEFKKMFGFKFSPTEKIYGPDWEAAVGPSYIFVQSRRCSGGGNSKQRRKAKRSHER